jgi:RNA-directed DNA polymerase
VTLGYELLATIETQHHFVVNANKTRMSSRHHRLEVTGITINEFPNVKRDFIDRIRGALKAWESHGYVSAQAAWQDRVAKGRTKPYEQRAWRRQTRGGGTPELANVLWGKLLYIRMVRGKDDSIYTRLAERYNSLRLREAASNLSFTCPSLPLERIVRNARDAESATFVIEWSGDYLAHGATTTQAVFGQGTAFAYGRSEQLISCNHVLQGTVQIAGEEVTINFPSSMISNETFRAINPSTGAEYQFEIVRRDADRDLAVLKIVDKPLNHRYFVGLDAPLHRNENGFLVGYPNWSPGRTANLVEASVRNRYNRSALKRFEISQTIRQGNSGGPFVGSQFQLAGVAQQGATQTNGNDECLCVTELNAWLTTLS